MSNRLTAIRNNLDPWAYMVGALTILGLLGVVRYGYKTTLPQLTIGPVVAGTIDVLYHGLRRQAWYFPLSGVITGLICALVLPLHKPVAVGIAALVAIVTKHTLTTHDRHIFNPAGLGIVLVARWSGLPLAWWGETFVWATIALGVINVITVRRFIQSVSALVSYGIAFAITQLNSASVNSTILSRAILGLPWFFLLFMVPEPKTSVRPVIYQLLFGLVVGCASIGFSYTPFRDYTLIYGLLTANVLAAFIRSQESDTLVGKRVSIQ